MGLLATCGATARGDRKAPKAEFGGAVVSRARPSQRASLGTKRGARQVANTTRTSALRQCNFAEGCDAQAKQVRFGIPGEKERFCRKHKQAAHRNLNNYRSRTLCQYTGGCDKLGTFGLNVSALAANSSAADTGDKQAASRESRKLFCKDHKQAGAYILCIRNHSTVRVSFERIS